MRRLKERGLRDGRSMSSLVEEALVRFLDGSAGATGGNDPALPVFRAGVPRVDIADRNALADVLDQQ